MPGRIARCACIGTDTRQPAVHPDSLGHVDVVAHAVRALRDGVDRNVARYYGNPGCEPALVRPRPGACFSFAQRDLTDERHLIDLNAHNTVHLVASAVSSGVLGIQREWP